MTARCDWCGALARAVFVSPPADPRQLSVPGVPVLVSERRIECDRCGRESSGELPDARCVAISVRDDLTRCRLIRGHLGVHRADTAAWGEPQSWQQSYFAAELRAHELGQVEIGDLRDKTRPCVICRVHTVCTIRRLGGRRLVSLCDTCVHSHGTYRVVSSLPATRLAQEALRARLAIERSTGET